MKNIIAIIVFVGIIGLVGIAFIPGIIDKNQSRNAAEGVLDNVIEQNYEKAFESIYFYDRASDLEPTISYEDAKNKWIKRVKALKEKGVYVVEYNKLRVRLDDTYPKGTVDLVIMENGKKTVKDDVSLWFAQREGSWKLGNLHYYKDDVEEEWKKVLSGHFNNNTNNGKLVLPEDIPDFVQESDFENIDWVRKAVKFGDRGIIGNENKSGVIGADMPS